MNISDEAVEAAAEALVGSTLGDRGGINWEEFFEAARGALKAAAPYIAAGAWQAGCEEGLSYNPGHDEEALAANPYRTQP